MQPGAYLQPDRLHTVTNRTRATDCACRTVERREHPIPRRLDPGATEPFEFPPHHSIVISEEFAPTPIAETRGQPSRVHDVSEEDRREHSVEGHLRETSSEELLHRIQQRNAVGREWRVVRTRYLEQFRSCDVF